MSLPPGFLDELRNRTSMVAVAGRKVMWDTRKSNQGKGDMWAPCPFHQEKTASFHVDDRKGFYYCFGCHAKGDAISFVRETENMDFMEAIELLAREAGLPMPERDPQAQERADLRSELTDVMEQAVQYYRLQLQTAVAAQARDYLSGRGFDAASLARWDIGFAPDVRQGVLTHLTAKGVDQQHIIDAGLAAAGDDGRAPFDRFRGRIIFPIRDGRGRCIALGGRAMDPNARAKYLNSPETPLFDKGRSLYNHGPAREAAGKGQPLIVAEGYMDVIALAEAGFGAVVAPLGTAITEDQLRLLWRIDPEPIIALDGDTAGLRAAMRVIDTALPLLEAGQSLRFCLMPEGMDPDDVVKTQGAQAMRALLEQAQPMVQLLWRRETEGKVLDSPERRAALDKTLRSAIREIRDPSIRAHYGEALKDLRIELFQRSRPGGATKTARGPRVFRPGAPRWQPPQPARSTTKSSALASRGGGVEDYLREAVILATCITTPAVIEEFETALENLDMVTPEFRDLRNAVLAGAGNPALRERISSELGPESLENLFAQRHVAISASVRNPGDADIARACLAEELAKLEARRGVVREIEEAAADIADLVDEGLTWRLAQAAQALNRAARSENEDKTVYETAPNGARLNREEQSALHNLLGQIDYTKRR